MRNIKFRGKRKDNGQWVLGSLTIEYDGTYNINYWVSKLLEPENNYSEMVHEMHEVTPETVGQNTGHELDLYEGDIVNYVTGSPSKYVNATVLYGEYETISVINSSDPDFNENSADVEKHFGFYINDGESDIPLGNCWLQKIGNVFDNPNLIHSIESQNK